MPYRLYCFDVRGRSEAIRQLFKISGVKFVQEIVSNEEWCQMKSEMPMSQLPVLEVDGQKIAQSLAILRFLGRQFDRAGRNALESAKLDMIADYVQEMWSQPEFSKWLYEDPKTDKIQHFKEKIMPLVEHYAPTIERFLLESGTHLFGLEKETWVDIFVAETFSRVEDFGMNDALSAYPHIQQLIRRIHSAPAIQQHLKERPTYSC